VFTYTNNISLEVVKNIFLLNFVQSAILFHCKELPLFFGGTAFFPGWAPIFIPCGPGATGPRFAAFAGQLPGYMVHGAITLEAGPGWPAPASNTARSCNFHE
jgi:hypothetical protein